MKKIILILLMFVILLAPIMASDKDVAYVTQTKYTVRAEITSALNELGLSYDNIYSSNLSTANFSKYKMIIVNPDYFSYPSQIPVNNISAVVVNGDNLCSWGWCKYITTQSSSSPFHIDLILSNKITEGFSLGDIQVYTSSSPQINYIDDLYSFSGIKIVGSTKGSANDAVIAYAEKGDVLTRFGYPNTYVNARTVFFGITESSYWTNETKTLFKNSILWALAKDNYNLEINSGVNLVSIPLITNPIDVSSLISQYPQINSVKTYAILSGEIINAVNIENQKGYFIYSNSSFALSLSGDTPLSDQTINFKSGMNLVGFSNLNNMSLTSLPSEIIEVSTRNPSNGEYNIATKYGGMWFNPSNIILEPGKGYWIKSKADVTWT